MKRATLVLIAAMFLLVGLVSACAPKPAAEKITLKAISAWKSDQWITKTFIEHFVPDVNKRAKGRLEIQVVGHTEIIKAADQLTACGQGTIDMVCTYSNYYSGIVPEIVIIGLPVESWAGENWLKLAKAIKAPLEKIIVEKTGAKLLAVTGPNTMCLVTTKKPLTKVDELKGMKVRTTGGWDAVLLEALAAAPVKIPSEEIYTAAERGVIDGASRPIRAVLDWREYEVWKYLNPLPPYVIDGISFINQNVFSKLPADLQKLLIDASTDWEVTAHKYYIEAERDALRQLPGLGTQVRELSSEEAAKYLSISRENARKYFAKASPTHSGALIAALEAAMK